MSFVSDHPPEHIGADVPGRLQLLMCDPLRLQQRPQRHRERKHARFVILCGVRVQPNFTGVEIDLPPFERQDLTVSPPAGNPREQDPRADLIGQLTAYCHYAAGWISSLWR